MALQRRDLHPQDKCPLKMRRLPGPYPFIFTTIFLIGSADFFENYLVFLVRVLYFFRPGLILVIRGFKE